MSNKARKWRSVIAMVLVVSMLFSIFPVAAFADDTKTINYVSIGDSMANGYCFDGYLQGESNNPDYNFLAGDGVYGKGAYPLQFEEYLEGLGYDVEHTMLASSAMRAEDLNYLLGGLEGPADGWYDQVENYTGVSDYDTLSKHYQKAIADADIITLGIGNASFGAFMLQEVTNAIGVMGDAPEIDPEIKLEYALEQLDAEQQAVVMQVYEELEAELLANIPAELAEQYNVADICDIVAYTAAGYILNYKEVLDNIVALNPDVEIILVGLMNTTYGMEITGEGMDPIPVGDVMDAAFGALNAYAAGLPTVMQAAGEWEDATFYYAEQPNPLFIVQVFDDLKANNWNNIQDGRLSGDIVRDRNITAYNDSLRLLISAAFAQYGLELPETTLALVKEYNGNWRVGNYGPVNINEDISTAIYLGIEDAVANNVDTNEIPLDGLTNISDINALMGVFTGLNLDVTDPTMTPERIRTTLGDYLNDGAVLSAMCKIYALFKVGNGMSVHPTPEGHDNIAAAVIEAYENGYTAQDETKANLLVALEALSEVVAEYYDEAYAYAYAEADKAGYIDDAVEGIDDVIDALKAIDLSEAGLTAELEAKVVAEIESIIETLTAAKDLIQKADVLDQETLDALMALLNEAGQDMEQLLVVLEQAGVDVNDLVIIPALNEAHNILINEVLPEIERNLQEAMEAGIAWLMEQAPEAMEALKEALYDLAVQTGDDIYWFLYNNPDKVVGFFNEYGDDMLVLMEDYGPYALAAMGWIAQNYGEDILDFVMDNHEEILEVTAMLLEKHGENAAKLINVYAEYLGWCDEVRDLIADVEGEIEDLKAQLEELNTQLEDLYAQLENLYEELENASEEAKAEIEAAIEQIEALIAEVEAAIEQIEDAIAQLEAQLKELNEQLEEAYKAIEAIVEAIEEAVESGIETVEEILEVIEAVVDYAEETIAGVKTAVEAIVEAVEDIVDFTEELIANGIIAAEQVEEILSYIVGVINGVIEELEKGNVEKVIEELRNQLTNGYAELYDMLTALDVVFAEELAAIVDDLEIALAKAEQEFKVAMYNATHGTISCEAETYSVIPVAGADATVNAADGYVDAVTSEWNLRMVTEGETPDVLFYQVDPQIFVDALLSEEYIPSWEKYITDEKVLAYFNEKKAELKANLVAEYSENVVNILEPMIDRLMFAVVEYAVYNIQALERISAQYDDTLIVAVGMYNPVQGMNITMDGEVIDVAELCQDMIEVTDVYNLLYAVASQGVVFVDVSEADAEKIGNVDLDLYAKLQNIDMSNLTWEEIRELLAAAAVLDEVLMKLENSNYATEDGHAYIAKQILAAITVEHTGNNTECDVCTPKEEVKGMKGDVNLDGRVYTDDAVTLMRHVVGLEEITDPVAIYNADVVCDDRLYTDDAVMIMRYVVGLVDSLN